MFQGSVAIADGTIVRVAGLLLLIGAGTTLGLHYLGAPEDLYRWLYDHLLSGLDVPDEPSHGSLDAIGRLSLIGGLVELLAGLGLLAWTAQRGR